jgi:hypothetical protein
MLTWVAASIDFARKGIREVEGENVMKTRFSRSQWVMGIQGYRTRRAVGALTVHETTAVETNSAG